MDQKKIIHDSLLKLEKWSSKEDWKAYDTFDGLSSPFARIFTLGGIPFLKQCWQQGIRRFPLNIRPMLLIKKAHSSKGMGFYAQGYLRLYQMTNDEAYLNKMRNCLEWLLENRCHQFKGNAWGNHFDYQSRGGRIPPGTPTVVWTSLIGHAFLDAYETIQEDKYFEAAQKATEFIINELGWTETGKDICLNYIPKKIEKREDGSFDGIHNSNVLGAGLLARVNGHQPNSRYLEIAKEAIRFTIRDQHENGAWWYGQHRKYHWIDSFHTAYNLESIGWYIRCSGDLQFKENLQRGYQYWINNFFDEDGTPHYYDYKAQPLDIQCSSQAIQTMVNLKELHENSISISCKVANWTIRNMQDKAGYFYYRKYPMITNKTPTLHWGQATMFAALSILDQSLLSSGEIRI